MKSKYYFNDLTRIADIKNFKVIVNTENRTVIGLDKIGQNVLEKLSHQLIDSKDLTEEEKEVFDTLLEFDMISGKEYNRERHEKIRLVSAYVHVTNHCNLHCLGCYSLDEKRNVGNDLTFSELKHVFSELKRLGASNVVISGGEPFLRSDIYNLLEYIKNDLNYQHVTIITNGTVLIKYEILNKLVDEITVSVDGYSEDSDSFIRDKGIFTNIMTTIRQLKENNISVSMLPTLHKKNSNRVQEYMELAKSMGVPINFSILSVCDDPLFEDYMLEENHLITLSESMLQMGGTINDSGIGAALQAGLNCGAGQIIVSIDSSGNVYPCHMLHRKEFMMGCVLTEALDDIIRKSIVAKDFKETNADTVSDCKGCEYRYFCSTGCRARSYFKYGTIHRKDSYCVLSKHFYNEVMSKVAVQNQASSTS